MDRRTSLKLLAAATGAALGNGAVIAAPRVAAASRRPNVLLIVVDDLRWDEYGAGGHPYLKTPNIDRLAREGVTFERAFHATPLCSPNRACILTGEYASTHGIYGNADRTLLSRRLRTMTLHLKSAGYETGHVGKWHMGDDPAPRPGYDYWAAFPAQGRIIDPELWTGDRLQTVRGYVTDLLTDRALQFLERRDRARPFFLYLGHKAVHPDLDQLNDGSLDLARGSRYIAAPRHAGRYANEVYARAATARGPIGGRSMSRMTRHILSLKDDPLVAEHFATVIDPGTAEESIRQRAEMMLAVDESTGALLDALAARGDLDDTVVLFTSDNGFFFGEHGLSVERRLPYEESIRMPLLVRYPGIAAAGGRVSELASSTDVAPTVLDLAGIPVPSHVQGKSMKAALDGRTVGVGRKGVLTEYYADDRPMPWMLDADYKAIRTNRYKYIHWIQYPEFDELYDIAADPLETRNMLEQPHDARIVAGLRHRLAGLVAESVGLET